MKNILTNAKARTLARKDIRRAFKLCRFVDALDPQAQSQPAPFNYHYNKKRGGEVGDYIVYQVINSDSQIRADDRPYIREVDVQIDLFSTSGFESKLLTSTLQDLEIALIQTGFDLSQDCEDYEPDTHLYHIALTATKLYGGY